MNPEKHILITGAKGFIGKNLTVELKNRGYNNLMLYDIDSTQEQFVDYCEKAQIVVHLAGVNRPKDTSEFYEGNTGFTEKLLQQLKQCGNSSPIVVTSSIQAELDNDYGKSKAQAEQALYNYSHDCGVPVYLYRLVGIFGKWCRPNYNSVVATFCHNIANNLPITISNPDAVVTLSHIDDVICEICSVIERENHVSSYSPLQVNPQYKMTLQALSDLIYSFKSSRTTLATPQIGDELSKKLYGTYTSYIPSEQCAYNLVTNIDERGQLTEFIKNEGTGQLFVSVTKPGITRGNHWHHTKTEKFFVVSGNARISIRNINDNIATHFDVSGEEPTVVDMPTGCTHLITNTGTTDLVTLFWSSEIFDKQKPDTYFLEV